MTTAATTTANVGVVLLLCSVAAGCGKRTSDSGQPQSASPTASLPPLEMRLGWVVGSCLATADRSLAAGAPITVVALDEKTTIVEGRVVSATTSDAVCPPLLPDRRRVNEPKWSFYELQLPATVTLGIGVAGDRKVLPGGIDVTGDGKPETFTQCSTSEGISFRVWRGAPYQGAPLWSGDYYLGYDVDANCPS